MKFCREDNSNKEIRIRKSFLQLPFHEPNSGSCLAYNELQPERGSLEPFINKLGCSVKEKCKKKFLKRVKASRSQESESPQPKNNFKLKVT